MIQRKQTVFLALAALLAGLMFAFPLVSYLRMDHQAFVLRIWGLFNADGSAVPDVALKLPIHVVTGILVALLLACIFLYGSRGRQLRFVRMTYLFALAVQVGALITHMSVRAYLAQGSSVEYTFGPSYFFPIGILVLSYLAERGIRKDEELIKSMDRLR
ncbi:MAG: DUF4293 domain-containing protein [Flavobacteriales bacterium]|nr:DUF4293 domain-containing protein [Flavobacteriales bacterium]